MFYAHKQMKNEPDNLLNRQNQLISCKGNKQEDLDQKENHKYISKAIFIE